MRIGQCKCPMNWTRLSRQLSCTRRIRFAVKFCELSDRYRSSRLNSSGVHQVKSIIGINGCCGRMGMRIVQLAHEDKELCIGAALEFPGHPDQGKDIGEIAGIGKLGVPVSMCLPADHRFDVVIDFSTPEGTLVALSMCVPRRI